MKYLKQTERDPTLKKTAGACPPQLFSHCFTQTAHSPLTWPAGVTVPIMERKYFINDTEILVMVFGIFGCVQTYQVIMESNRLSFLPYFSPLHSPSLSQTTNRKNQFCCVCVETKLETIYTNTCTCLLLCVLGLLNQCTQFTCLFQSFICLWSSFAENSCLLWLKVMLMKVKGPKQKVAKHYQGPQS